MFLCSVLRFQVSALLLPSLVLRLQAPASLYPSPVLCPRVWCYSFHSHSQRTQFPSVSTAKFSPVSLFPCSALQIPFS